MPAASQDHWTELRRDASGFTSAMVYLPTTWLAAETDALATEPADDLDLVGLGLRGLKRRSTRP